MIFGAACHELEITLLKCVGKMLSLATTSLCICLESWCERFAECHSQTGDGLIEDHLEVQEDRSVNLLRE